MATPGCLSGIPTLAQIVADARADESTLQPALVRLAADAPDVLELVRQNQAEFLELLNAPAASPSIPHPQAAAPTPATASIPITILHNGKRHELDLDLAESVAVLRLQVFSVTDVLPEDQQITGLGPGVLLDDADLPRLGIASGTWASLSRKPRAPSADAPAAAFAPDRHGQELMEERLASGFATASAHADAQRQEAARSVVPWEELRSAARAHSPAETSGRGPSEAELKELLRWFKHDFFAWVDRPACEATGEPTELVGMGAPTAGERADGAGRVELYRGPTGHVTRFPRLNDPAALLRTRRGRCGEWANCFALVASAVGFDCRWVLDVTDHVWCEVYLEARSGWVHCDPCEAAFDAPLMCTSSPPAPASASSRAAPAPTRCPAPSRPPLPRQSGLRLRRRR